MRWNSSKGATEAPHRVRSVGVLGGLLDGVRWLSVGRWSQAIAEPVAGVSLVDGLGAGYAVVATVVVLVVGTWLTSRRLRAFNLTGDE